MRTHFLRFFVAFLGLILLSCASAKLILNSITGTEELTQGEKGFIRWSFANCDSVKVEGISGVFKATDETVISPVETTTYKVLAYRRSDSLAAFWTVHVRQASEQKIQTGGGIVRQKDTATSPALATTLGLSESAQPSSYFSGVASASHTPVLLKIMQILPDAHSLPQYHAILLDNNGNYVAGYNTDAWKLKVSCTGNFSSLKLTPSIRESMVDSRDISVAVCADYALYMQPDLTEVEKGYSEFFNSLSTDDEISFLPFDHRPGHGFTLVSGMMAHSLFQPGQILPASSLTALYKSAYAGIKVLKNSSRKNKILVLITGGAENASLIYTIHDVAKTALQEHIALYTVAVGSGVDTYSLRYLAEYTGGRYYKVSSDHAGQIGAILKEITLADKAYYQVDIDPATEQLSNISPCSGMLTSTLSAGAESQIMETRSWNIPVQPLYPYHEIVATFSGDTYDIDSMYAEHLSSLAIVLKDNPFKSIEVIGHSSLNGNDDACMKASLQRAQAVRKYLMDHGVLPSQLRMRGCGRETPLYYLEQQDWQAVLNRRVEIRWLDASLKPYEIMAQTVYTEEEAIKQTDAWEAKGVKAYYELVLLNRMPAFRIKLWGYDTYESALSAKSTLQKQSRVPLTVQ